MNNNKKTIVVSLLSLAAVISVTFSVQAWQNENETCGNPALEAHNNHAGLAVLRRTADDVATTSPDYKVQRRESRCVSPPVWVKGPWSTDGNGCQGQCEIADVNLVGPICYTQVRCAAQ